MQLVQKELPGIAAPALGKWADCFPQAGYQALLAGLGVEEQHQQVPLIGQQPHEISHELDRLPTSGCRVGHGSNAVSGHLLEAVTQRISSATRTRRPRRTHPPNLLAASARRP